jgi:hypothetical protein
MNGKKTILVASANDYTRDDWASLLLPPLALLTLGAYLTAHDVPVELIDVQMDFGFGTTRDAERVISERVTRYLHGQADAISWIGISMTTNSSSGLVLAQHIHAALPDIPIVLGGYFPSSSYQFLLREYPFITAIVRSDGEAAALEISRSLAQGRSFLDDRTPNLAWLDDGQVRTTPVRAIDLEDAPDLDVRMLHNPTRYPAAILTTSRGCLFKCSYCLEVGMRSYATYSPAWVARQLAHLEAELPNEHIFIGDPLFGGSRERTIELCHVLGEHRFTYALQSRVDVLSPDLVPILRSAGVEAIFLGIESASPPTLMRMNKVRSIARGKDYVKRALAVLEACFENDITPFVPIMLPFPGDSVQDFQDSLEFVQEAKQLHDQITTRTGVATGFLAYVWNAKTYTGIPLERRLEEFPETVLGPETFIGERTVISPSPDITPEVIARYHAEIDANADYTPLSVERVGRYFSFVLEQFFAEHPDLTDDQGVTLLGDKHKFAPFRTA